MKRMLTVIAALVLSLVLAGAASAAGIKVPKEICLELTSAPDVYLCLATKAGGSIKFSDNNKVKYYAIDGSFNQIGTHFPIGGTGYINGSFF